MYDNYSVLMSVYYKDNAEYLRESIESMLSQSLVTDDFVLVCDGPLTDELDTVIDGYVSSDNNKIFNVVRLEKNGGLGNALNAGIVKCKNSLVARMDSDDISLSDRCEKEIGVFNSLNDISIVGSCIREFEGNIKNLKGKRNVPLNSDEIYIYSKKRNPFNHPAVMYKKDDVIDSGGYSEEFHLFEDYHLWIRMFLKGYKGYNIKDCLLYMRTDQGQIARRGGTKYTENMLKFHRWIKSTGWTDNMDFITGAMPHAVITMMPAALRKQIYGLLRKN